MKVLVACEYSGAVRDAFIAQGHDAMSCDLLPTDVPGPHYQGSLFDIAYADWDLIIAHPPCTTLCVSGNAHYADSAERISSLEFVEAVWDLPCPRLCIENPVGVIPTTGLLPVKPQYIQPYQFGHGETKKTGLWKRGLPDLVPTDVVSGREQRIANLPPSQDRWKIRSATYPGIASAMAKQWGHLTLIGVGTCFDHC